MDSCPLEQLAFLFAKELLAPNHVGSFFVLGPLRISLRGFCFGLWFEPHFPQKTHVGRVRYETSDSSRLAGGPELRAADRRKGRGAAL